MEVPKKIYLTKNLLGVLRDGWDAKPSEVFTNIEYTRTDAFIEKACEFISDRIDILFNVEYSNGEPLADSYSEYASARLEAANKIIDDFRKYMKGE